jgi:hypothetical protein
VLWSGRCLAGERRAREEWTTGCACCARVLGSRIRSCCRRPSPLLAQRTASTTHQHTDNYGSPTCTFLLFSPSSPPLPSPPLIAFPSLAFFSSFPPSLSCASSRLLAPAPARSYRFDTTGVEIEGGSDTGVDAQFPWEWRPSKSHTSFIHIDTFDIDECV